MHTLMYDVFNHSSVCTALGSRDSKNETQHSDSQETLPRYHMIRYLPGVMTSSRASPFDEQKINTKKGTRMSSCNTFG